MIALFSLLLVERTLAWSGVGGESCAFPTVDYLSLDQGAGISATSSAAGLGGNVYVAGYMTGTLDVVSHDGTQEIAATSAATSSTMALHVTALDNEGKNTKSWIFSLSEAFSRSFAFSHNVNVMHSFPDQRHLAVGFRFLGTATPPGSAPLENPGTSTVGGLCKLDSQGDAPVWCRMIGDTDERGGSVHGADGDSNGDLIAIISTCAVGTTQDDSGRFESVCTRHLQKRASADGAELWSKELPVDASDVRVMPGTNEIFLLATVTNSVTIDDIAINGGEASGVVLKMTADGVATWAATVGAGGNDFDLAVDGSKLVVMGPATGGRGDFAAMIDPANGTIAWEIDNLPPLRGIEVTAGPDNYVAMYGQTYGDGVEHRLVDATGSSMTLRSRGSYDLFVIKVDSNGRGIWALDGGGDGMEYFWGMSMDANHNIYISGYTRSAVLTFGHVQVSNPAAEANGGDNLNRLFTVRLAGEESMPSCLSSCDLSVPPTTGCYIDHYCVEAGELAPYSNFGCYECNPEQDPWDWSGPNLDNHCFIDGHCLSDQAPRMVVTATAWGGTTLQPSDCEACDVSKSKTLYSVRAGFDLSSGSCAMVSPSPPPPPPSPAAPMPPPPMQSIGSGAVAGVAVGAAVIGALIASLFFLCFLCFCAKRKSANPSTTELGPDQKL